MMEIGIEIAHQWLEIGAYCSHAIVIAIGDVVVVKVERKVAVAGVEVIFARIQHYRNELLLIFYHTPHTIVIVFHQEFLVRFVFNQIVQAELVLSRVECRQMRILNWNIHLNGAKVVVMQIIVMLMVCCCNVGNVC